MRGAAAGLVVVPGPRAAPPAAAVAAELLDSWPDRRLVVSGAGNETASASDLVVLATPWDAALPTVRQLRDALAGKTVVSVANALVKQGREMHALVPARGSVAASVQAALPRSAVAAAAHHLPAATLAELASPLGADVLVCADDDDARSAAMALVDSIDGLRAIDAGSLASAGAVEAFTAVLITVNIRYKAHSMLRLVGLGDH